MKIRNSAVIKVNSNFHHIAGEDLYKSGSDAFRAYRDKWREWPENFRAGDFPLFIDIETSSVCNLSCPFCATTFRKGAIEEGLADGKLVKKIIDEGADNGLCGIKLNLRGEPLLHPMIAQFVRYAKSKGLIDVYFNTNAVLLTEEVSGRLIDAGLDRISVSFEGVTREIYEKNRVGAKFDSVLSNIRNLQELKMRRGVSHPKLRVQTVMLPEIAATLDDYKKFWSRIADEVAFLDYKEMKEKRRLVMSSWACPQLWQRMAVWWDGSILACNHDDEGLLVLGNANKMTIKDAWNSDILNRAREAHRTGRAHSIAACDGCYLRDSEISKGRDI